ncbi:calcium-activated chloride channel regulator 1-like [Saccoglossus kowalevskii]|uniref:Calcium-activated chloride channel regulator 4-like n=1 Tax=Saccoglossus kowalevskii TaxID=10224 RepID=A0ABM0GJU5_SACKO|nr:PREDICTED: calcium-activated chloride channel regulator 4-like [Saccoglossus kowalevskii]
MARLILVLLCLAVNALYIVHGSERNPIYLVDNKYTPIHIAIHSDVEESPAMIDDIEDLITEASAYLYEATRHRAHFKDITIVIPHTWKYNPHVRATTESYDTANIIIDDPNPIYGHNPYVSQHSPCGQPGEYMHLTPNWITGSDTVIANWGPQGKVIVHEWGHLQWGLFDEYPTEDYNHFYLHDGKAEPTRCSETITGDTWDSQHRICDLDTTDLRSLDKRECRFYPHEDNTGTGSYLYVTYVDSVTDFCHSEEDGDSKSRHNSFAPNKHNAQCVWKSAWDVMLTTPDFTNNANPPKDGLDTSPIFSIVKETPFRTVLVMDLSGSMDSYNRVDLQLQAATRYIGNTLPNDTWVGIVRFDTDALVVADLTKLDSEETRMDLISKLPSNTGGSTCIGCGLELGIEVLENSPFGDAGGGVIFLTTDGEENSSPYIEDVLPELLVKEVRVDCLAFGDDADETLQNLAEETGGRFAWYSELVTSTALHDSFTASVTERMKSDTETIVELVSDKIVVDAKLTKTGYIDLDTTIGRDTNFFFFWDFSSTSEIVVQVIRPDGSVIDHTDAQYHTNAAKRSVVIRIDGIAESGTWTYDIYNPDYNAQTVEVHIDSRSADPSTEPMRLSTFPSSSFVDQSPPMVIIYAHLRQGHTPIMQAKVIATVERPSPHSPVDLQLSDNGSGADITKDDGTYSAYFVDFVESTCTTCYYSIQVAADDNGGAAVFSLTIKGGAMPRNYYQIPEEEPTSIGDFIRVASGGGIKVDDSVTYIDWSDPSDDPFPPARIMDIRVSGTSYENQTVTLEWTATGDDLDQGTGSLYDLRYETNFAKLVNDFDNSARLFDDDLTEGTLSDPKASGMKEMVTAILPYRGANITYYFSVRAIDDVGNVGHISNVAQTTIIIQAVPTPAAITSTVPEEEISDNSHKIVAVALIILIVFVFLCMIVCLCMCCKMSKLSTKVHDININCNKADARNARKFGNMV